MEGSEGAEGEWACDECGWVSGREAFGCVSRLHIIRIRIREEEILAKSGRLTRFGVDRRASSDAIRLWSIGSEEDEESVLDPLASPSKKGSDASSPYKIVAGHPGGVVSSMRQSSPAYL